MSSHGSTCGSVGGTTARFGSLRLVLGPYRSGSNKVSVMDVVPLSPLRVLLGGVWRCRRDLPEVDPQLRVLHGALASTLDRRQRPVREALALDALVGPSGQAQITDHHQLGRGKRDHPAGVLACLGV